MLDFPDGQWLVAVYDNGGYVYLLPALPSTVSLVLPTAQLGAASHRAELLFWASQSGKSARGYNWLGFQIERL